MSGGVPLDWVQVFNISVLWMLTLRQGGAQAGEWGWVGALSEA